MEIKKRGVRCRKCGGKGTIHQTRNGKRQYKCKECGGYFTSGSKHERATNSKLLDDFLATYSNIHTYEKGGNQEEPDIKLSVALKEIPTSSKPKSTVYRNKSRIKTLAILCTWFRKAEIISDWDYKNFNLRIWYQRANLRSEPTLEVSVSPILNKQDRLLIEFKALKNIFNRFEGLSFVTIIPRGEYYVLVYETNIPRKEEDLHPLLTRFRYLKA